MTTRKLIIAAVAMTCSLSAFAALACGNTTLSMSLGSLGCSAALWL